MTASRSTANNYPGSPFVGREPELAALREALVSALDGHGRIVLVTGEPGIGKTRTAEEILAEAHEKGAEVLWGRCQEWEGAPAYWPWLQILRRYVERTSEETIATELSGLANDLSQIMPELARFSDTEQSGTDASPEQRRFRLFDAMARLLRAVSQRQPLILVLDDVHWADQPSLRLLEFVAQDVHELPLLLIATYRNVELDRGHPLTSTLAELSRDPASRRIVLHGLGSDAVSRYIELTADREAPPGLVDAVLEETEGNPFFMTEVVGWLRSEGRLTEGSSDGTWTIRIPESVREAVGIRLDRLSRETNEILTAAAVIGREFQLQLLARTAEIETLDLLDRLDEAVQTGVLEELEQPGNYRFSHALIQETLYDELTTSRRIRLHATVGMALESLHASDLVPHSAELARHFAEAALAGNADKAVDYATKAGDQAMGQGAWELAVTHYEQALELVDASPAGSDSIRCELLLRLSDAHWTVGDAVRGKHTARESAQIAEDLADGRRLGQAALLFAGGTRLVDWVPDGTVVDLIVRALDRLPDDEERLRSLLLSRAVHFSDTTQEAVAPARERAALAVQVADKIDDRRALLEALWAEQHAHLFGDDCFKEEIVAERRARQARIQMLSDEPWEHFQRYERFMEALLLGESRIEDLYDTLRWFDEVSHASRMPVHRAYTTMLESTIATMEGRFNDAERLAIEAFPAAAGSSHEPEAFSIHGQFLFVVYREQERLADFIDDIVPFTGDPGFEVYWQIRLILARIEIGDIDEARREYDRIASDDFAALPPDWNWLENVATLGEIAHLLNDAGGAATLYEMLLPYKTYNAAMIYFWDFIGAVAYYLGLLATTLERWDDAEEHFRFALERHEFMQLPPYITNTQHQYATMLAKRGDAADIEQARDLNEQALETAREMGMVRLERLATALTEEIEAQDRVSDDGARYDLTPRELQVLACLVRGSTDREIADELSISHRTVQVHVSRILSKLGVGSRTAAVALAIREELG